MPTTTKKPRRRRLIAVTTYATGTGDGQTFGCTSMLPLGSANTTESENAAARIMRAVNAQLDYAKSDLRLVLWDCAKECVIDVVIPGE